MQLVNEFLGSGGVVPILGAKNIMTGLNVAFTIPGDWFVVDQIDSQLTAKPSDSQAGYTRIFFRPQCSAERRKKR